MRLQLEEFTLPWNVRPITIGIPLDKNNWTKKAFVGLLYNLGRIITYGIPGAIFGLLGRGIQLTGLLQWASHL
jgi:hypothetical protein